jgi:hypothetical protein
MPLQNRVTPFGDIVALPQRGLFIGNRGIIHDPVTKTLLKRRWTTKAWLVCTCDYRGIRRSMMEGRSWTELFFLDEATALAAGHRPCFLCRRASAETFRAAWAAGNGVASPKASAIDRVLHRERLDGNRKRVHGLPRRVRDLPDGAMVAARDAAFLLLGGVALRWEIEGYRVAGEPAAIEGLLTPPSSLRALAAGYRPTLHPSAAEAAARWRVGVRPQETE